MRPVHMFKISNDIYEPIDVGKEYKYRICASDTSRIWWLYKQSRKSDITNWVLIEIGFKTKDEAIDYLLEYDPTKHLIGQATAEDLKYIDDNIDLNVCV